MNRRHPLRLYLRSASSECEDLIATHVVGQVPSWLKGTFLRNGPGMRTIGQDSYHHMFDGLALIQQFVIRDGIVSYRSRFLRSDSFNKNMQYNRIMVTEFGTIGFPDPCKTLLNKFMNNLFLKDLFTDNDVVGFYSLRDQLYVVSDSPLIRRLDPETLQFDDSCIDLSQLVAVTTFTSHPHTDEQGNSYNIGSNVGTYNIVCFPNDSEGKQEGAPLKGRIECQIPSFNPLNPSYHHSFGFTDKYFVVIEQPVYISIPGCIKNTWLSSGTSSDILKWDPKRQNRFWIIDRCTNQIVDIKLVALPFGFFHTVNTYQEGNHLVMDVVCYEDGNFLQNLFIDDIQHGRDTGMGINGSPGDGLVTRVQRFMLPLSIPPEIKVGDNLIDSGTGSSFLQADGSIFCAPQKLTSKGVTQGEMPTINYGRFNGKDYQFFYSLTHDDNTDTTGLMKTDVKKKHHLNWFSQGHFPSEPIFVQHPTDMAEDDGVILSLVIDEHHDRKGFLLILDAKTFDEIARCHFDAPSSLPPGFHGIWSPFQ